MIRGKGQTPMAQNAEKVMAAFRGRVITPKEIMAATGLSRGYVSDLLCHLLSTGQIVQAGYGKYQAANVR